MACAGRHRHGEARRASPHITARPVTDRLFVILN